MNDDFYFNTLPFFFFFFFFLPGHTRISGTVLSRSGDSGVIVPQYQEEKFSISHH